MTEWQNLICTPCLVLDCLDVLLHFQYVLNSSTAVEVGEPGLNGFELRISQYGLNIESMVLIQPGYGFNLASNGGNLMIPGDGNKEGDLVDEHDINHQWDGSMDFPDFQMVPLHSRLTYADWHSGQCYPLISPG